MRFKIAIFILLSLPMILLSACEMKYSNTDDTVLEDRSANMRNGVKTLSNPGSQIDFNKVDEMLKEVNLSFSSYALASKPDSVKIVIKKLERLLQKESVTNDQELQFSTYMMLGNKYLRLYSESQRESENYLEKASEYTNTAISIFEDDPKYKADLADCYSILTSVYVFNKEYHKAISLMKHLIEDFQEIGYGPYKNWFASFQIQPLYNLTHKDQYDFKSKRKTQTLDYLTMVSEKFKNEVGLSAQMQLVRHYYLDNKKDKAETLYNSVEKRLSSLDNPEFESHEWDRFQHEIKHLKEANTHNHQ